jgi:hypothetical protein
VAASCLASRWQCCSYTMLPWAPEAPGTGSSLNIGFRYALASLPHLSASLDFPHPVFLPLNSASCSLKNHDCSNSSHLL